MTLIRSGIRPGRAFVPRPRPALCTPLLAAVLLAGCATVRPDTSQDCPPPPPSSDYDEVPVVAQTGTEPYESVCQLSVRRMYLWVGSIFKNSSAFLIGDDLLLTAAHNVHEGLFSRMRRAEAVCGRTPEGTVWPEPVGFGGRDTEVARGYHFVFAPEHRDYALVRLPEPAGYRSSFRLRGLGEPEPTQGDTVYTAGHPSKKPLCMDRMHVASDTITSKMEPGDPFIEYDVETLGGNSGGPLWVRRGDDYVVVGVHIAPGRARRLDDAALKELATWGVPLDSVDNAEMP